MARPWRDERGVGIDGRRRRGASDLRASRLAPSARIRSLVTLELPLQRREPDLELRGRAGPVPTCGLHRGEDVLALDVLERPGPAHRPRSRHRDTQLLRQVLDLDAAFRGERHRVLNGVLDLPDVAWPLVADELVGR